MRHQTGEKVNTRKHGEGVIISVDERKNAYLVRWISDNKATWIAEKDVKA